MSKIKVVFVGKIIHSETVHSLQTLPFGILAVTEQGVIAFLDHSESEELLQEALDALKAIHGFSNDCVKRLSSSQMLIPGLVRMSNVVVGHFGAVKI